MSDTPIIPLQLRGITKHFGRLAVLRGVDLEVPGGSIVGLIGANGAGKTTLLSIIAGLLPAGEGERTFGSCEPSAIDQILRSRMAFVSHTAQLYPRLTALENLELFSDLRQAVGARVEPAQPLLARLGLGDAAHRLVGTFSRGMMQRLALARALLGHPDLLLLDEPFTALDRPGRQLLAEVLMAERDRGAAILLSSHDFEAIIVVSDRVVLLEGGKVVGHVQRHGDETGDFRGAVQRLATAMPDRAAVSHA